MKRALIGEFLAIIGSLWAIVLGAYVQYHLISTWDGSYGNSFWASAAQLGFMAPLILSLIVFALGIVILCVEFFRKNP